MARLNASWKADTMLGMYGLTSGTNCSGTLARIRAPRSPTELTSLPTPDEAKRDAIWSGTPALASCCGISAFRADPKTVPPIASPTVPPTWRKKVSAPVAAPSWVKGAAFWTTIVNAASVGPIPIPAITIQVHITGRLVVP